MLIELTDSLMGYSEGELDSLKRSLSNLLCGFYEGNHYLIASPAFCDFFKGILTDSICQASLHYMDVNGSFSPVVSNKLKVVLKDANPSDFEVDYKFFTKTLSIQPTFFLCESFNDVKFYKKIMRFYYPYSPTSSFDIPGSGEGTCEVFQKIQNLRCINLTIVDSDKTHSSCTLGKTADKCKRKYRSNNPNVKLYILNCHEAENLIPISFLLRRANPEGRRFLKKIRGAGLERELRYYDYKLGIRKTGLLDVKDYMSYFSTLYKGLYQKDINEFLASKTDNDELLPSIGKNCLTSFLDNTPDHLGSDYLDNERREIAEVVYSFLCSRGNDPLN